MVNPLELKEGQVFISPADCAGGEQLTLKVIAIEEKLNHFVRLHVQRQDTKMYASIVFAAWAPVEVIEEVK